MQVCRRHDCAYDGVCEACNLQDRLTEAENDLQSTRHELIQKEREVEALERDAVAAGVYRSTLETRISNLEAQLDNLHSSTR